MNRLSALFISFLAVAPYVSAHGFLGQISVDGTPYRGNLPGKNQGSSPIRMVSDISPVKGTGNPDITCGLSAQPAALTVPANPGSNITFQWEGGQDGGSDWPHNVGPLMTYMASCGSTDCSNFNASGAKWFKVAQSGQKPGGSTWYQADIMQGDSYSVTLDQNLAPGGYLIRNEIISLQLATSQGGAEFYPACAQLNIGGSGNGQPQSTVSFPGAYSDTDPGIFTPNVYNPGFVYQFPGPALSNLQAVSFDTTPAVSIDANFASGVAAPSAAPSTAAAQSSAPAAAPSSAAPAPAPTSSAAAAPASSAAPVSGSSTASASSAKGSCRVRAKANATNPDRRRHFSRATRRTSH
ncbi:glycoside hydrolase family 61 protein [Gelatoporia subvermispora B]|uniref:lytic cellulose monooxygenase (C4-dehydrogenating) n=1 Tax=Ceriporiopsis subvermispora (strain B) TaxID=914234 RepID=M2QVZ7_CERS8|nr:glycoside hydrolase family 61 protein [Gelatoporia subvermispora B]